ncbi:hypothetical protein KSS87_011097 [Heliosperma pusillum]|nr:hypothetical protein KSS87_011097 [Heliosperma pusillum]
MSEDSKKMEEIEMKMKATKKVYAEVILNTTKEAAGRVMLAERKAVGFHNELLYLKQDSARMMLHLSNSFKSQVNGHIMGIFEKNKDTRVIMGIFEIQDAEARSLNQQKKIDELEAQLGEAEGIIVDLRDELKQLHEKLETVMNNKKRASNGHIDETNEPLYEHLPHDNALNSSTSKISDENIASVGIASLHVVDSMSFLGKSNSDDASASSEDYTSFIMQNTEADLCRIGYPQRIRALERNLSTMKPPALKTNETQSLVNVLVESSEARATKNCQYPVLKKGRIMNTFVQSVDQPFLVCSSKTDEKNLNSTRYNDQTISTPRRSAGKTARYREAIASLRGKPRKKYVRSLKRPLHGQLKECSARLNLHSEEDPIEAVQALIEGASPKSEIMNRCNDVMVCAEGDGEEAREGLSQKVPLTSVDGLVGSELFDVPISEGFGSFNKQAENVRPLKFTFHRKCRKNVLRKLDDNIVPKREPLKRKLETLIDVSVVESNGLNNELHRDLKMSMNDASLLLRLLHGIWEVKCKGRRLAGRRDGSEGNPRKLSLPVHQKFQVHSEPEEYQSHSFVGSRGYQPSGLTHELRIFVGTWNVGGKSPVGSLAADLEEWLNLKSSVDIYVLGFQEIVPLNTKSVIGKEDYTDARKWNLLIGKTLNNREGCVWLTSTVTPLTNDEYQYAKPENSGRQTRLGRSTTPVRERATTQQGDQDGGTNAYKMMASTKMVGVFLTIWIKRDLLRKYRFSNVKATPVACGLMGYLGNKGAVSVSMSIDGTSFCFVTAHLASGEKKGDEIRRNQQVGEIFKRTVFPRLPLEIEDTLPLTILGHERIFWFGDLNYRLCMEDNRARELIRQKKWKELQKFDQLKKEQQHGGVFQGWKEGDIEFAPTYKYSVELGNRYTGDKHSPLLPNSAEKRRTPAWCDRIMWFGKGVEQLSYFRGESKFSDHRPVSALFITEIDVLKLVNSKTVALPLSKFLTSMNLSKYNVQSSNQRSTLLSLIKAEEGSTSGKALTVDNRQ